MPSMTASMGISGFWTLQRSTAAMIRSASVGLPPGELIRRMMALVVAASHARSMTGTNFRADAAASLSIPPTTSMIATVGSVASVLNRFGASPAR